MLLQDQPDAKKPLENLSRILNVAEKIMTRRILNVSPYYGSSISWDLIMKGKIFKIHEDHEDLEWVLNPTIGPYD